MKTSNNKKLNKEGTKSKVGQIRMISESEQSPKKGALNNKANLKKSSKSKTSLASKASRKTKKLNVDAAQLKEPVARPAININFKEVQKDISKEIPKSLLCNICKKLVKNPTKCYQCKALFCRECLLNILEKNHKCPKCFKIISENLIKNTGLENEFKNTYIKCKYTGCKESVNLYEYEEHLKVCPFKNIKDSLEIDNLVYFDSLPFNQDPYSNSVLMNYSVKKAENDINLNYDSSYVNYYENIEKNYSDLLHGKSDLAQTEIFKNIIENDKLLDDDIDALEARKNEVNDIVKELQNKINLNEIS
jgi:hypothetical protein